MEIGIMVEKDSAKAIISYDRRIMRLMMKKLRNFLFSRGKNSSEKDQENKKAVEGRTCLFIMESRVMGPRSWEVKSEQIKGTR